MFPKIKLKLRMIFNILIKMLIINIFLTSTANGKDDPVTEARKALKPLKFENADPEMIKFNHWIIWRYELNDKGKLTKIPYSIGKSGKLYKASSTNPSGWLTFKDVKWAYQSGKYEVDGVGFVFTENDPYCCSDFDHVNDPKTGESNKVALEEVIGLNSRVEESPSGTGWHCIFIGKIPVAGKKKDLEDGTGREMYFSKRYMTMTFDVPPGFTSSINNSEVEGLELFNKYWPDADITRTTGKKNSSSVSTCDIPERVENDPNDLLKDISPTKEQVIALCRNAANGAKFERLFNGDISGYTYNGKPDESRADMGLAGIIACYTNDYHIIKEIIQESALWDEKWERDDYCKRTIMTVIQNRWG